MSANPQAPAAPPTTPGQRSSWTTTVRAALLASLAVTLVLLAFSWPTKAMKTQDLTVDVVGPPALTQPLVDQLSSVGTFDPQVSESAQQARERINQRDTYGAIVVPADPRGQVEVLTAPAASPVAAQALTQAGNHVAAGLAARAQAQADARAATQPASPLPTQSVAVPTTAKVTEVVGFISEDPRGAGLGVAALPLAMGGIIGGVLISLMVRGRAQRVAAVLGYAVVGGLALAGVLSGWFGFLPEFWATTAVLVGALGATAATVVGLESLLGRPGLALGAVLTMFVGNPIASVAQPVEFLGLWGQIGQWFVPGAAATALRTTNYFPDASLTTPILALSAWAVVGTALILVSRSREPQVAPASRPVAVDAA